MNSDLITNDYLSQNKINEVVVMPGITTIPNYAFKDCNSLKRVAISDSVKPVKNYKDPKYKDCDKGEQK